jgi:hypothetical protein
VLDLKRLSKRLFLGSLIYWYAYSVTNQFIGIRIDYCWNERTIKDIRGLVYDRRRHRRSDCRREGISFQELCVKANPKRAISSVKLAVYARYSSTLELRKGKKRRIVLGLIPEEREIGRLSNVLTESIPEQSKLCAKAVARVAEMLQEEMLEVLDRDLLQTGPVNKLIEALCSYCVQKSSELVAANPARYTPR